MACLGRVWALWMCGLRCWIDIRCEREVGKQSRAGKGWWILLMAKATKVLAMCKICGGTEELECFVASCDHGWLLKVRYSFLRAPLVICSLTPLVRNLNACGRVGGQGKFTSQLMRTQRREVFVMWTIHSYAEMFVPHCEHDWLEVQCLLLLLFPPSPQHVIVSLRLLCRSSKASA